MFIKFLVLNNSNFMYKIFNNIVFLFSFFLFCSSCENKDTYEYELKQEKKQIDAFMKRNGFVEVDSYPADSIWDGKENVFYHVEDGIYINIQEMGDKRYAVQENDKVILKYIKYTLGDPMIALEDYTNYPKEYTYGYSTDATYGLLQAIAIMKYHGSKARVIIPSKLSSTTDMNNVIPHYYTIEMNIQ